MVSSPQLDLWHLDLCLTIPRFTFSSKPFALATSRPVRTVTSWELDASSPKPPSRTMACKNRAMQNLPEPRLTNWGSCICCHPWGGSSSSQESSSSGWESMSMSMVERSATAKRRSLAEKPNQSFSSGPMRRRHRYMQGTPRSRHVATLCRRPGCRCTCGPEKDQGATRGAHMPPCVAYWLGGLSDGAISCRLVFFFRRPYGRPSA